MNYLAMISHLEGQSEKSAKCSDDFPKSLTDIPRTLTSVSVLSVPDLDNLPEIARPDSTGLPMSPIQPGWLIAYRGLDGRLQGGSFDRDHATVAVSTYGAHGWAFSLTDGKTIPEQTVRGVAKIACDGQIVAAWTVREHGLDGRKSMDSDRV